MIWEDGQLKIRPGGKRNKATRGKKQKNRLVLPFDVPGREGEGERLVMLWRTGTIRFPQAVLNRINEVEEKGFKPRSGSSSNDSRSGRGCRPPIPG